MAEPSKFAGKPVPDTFPEGSRFSVREGSPWVSIRGEGMFCAWKGVMWPRPDSSMWPGPEWDATEEEFREAVKDSLFGA